MRLHAYVLMDNHVHLLATPQAQGDVGRMMQRLGRQYVGSFNARHGRTGTLSEGRYKASLVDSGRYMPACYRYIELNPVRARMIGDPAASNASPAPGPRTVPASQCQPISEPDPVNPNPIPVNPFALRRLPAS